MDGTLEGKTLQLTLAISGMCLFAFAGERVSQRLLSSGHDAAVTKGCVFRS